MREVAIWRVLRLLMLLLLSMGIRLMLPQTVNLRAQKHNQSPTCSSAWICSGV